jgi:hypothetical protein
MSTIPHLPGIMSADELCETVATIVGLQQPSGMIPWFVGGHCDPWNHIETAMALDVAGFNSQAEHAYQWLVATQSEQGWWHNYYMPSGAVSDHKIDSNVCAYIAAGVWHHWLYTSDRAFVEYMWQPVRKAIDFVLSMARPDGTILWAQHPGERPWDFALLTGSSSIAHSLRCAIHIADLLEEDHESWSRAHRLLEDAIRDRPQVFEPKVRWAMDWYYPVLCGVVTGFEAERMLASRWDEFVMPGKGVRCVHDEPWVTAAETAECALSYAAIGDMERARELLECTRPHRDVDGAYWTGIVYPQMIQFPVGERSAYTSAAVILATDSIAGNTVASRLFWADDHPLQTESAFALKKS